MPTRFLPGALILLASLTACAAPTATPERPTRAPRPPQVVPSVAPLGPTAQVVGLAGATLINLDSGNVIGVNGATLTAPRGPLGSAPVAPAGGVLGTNASQVPDAPKVNTQAPPSESLVLGSGQGGVLSETPSASPTPTPTRSGRVELPNALRGQATPGSGPAPAGARVYLLDGSGKLLVQDTRTLNPVAAETNAQGAFTFAAGGPGYPCWAFVPLDREGGTWRGFRDLWHAERPLAVTPASTLVAAWVEQAWSDGGLTAEAGLAKLSASRWDRAVAATTAALEAEGLDPGTLDWAPGPLREKLRAMAGRHPELGEALAALTAEDAAPSPKLEAPVDSQSELFGR